MKTQVDVLREGAALARRFMHVEANEWRLLVAIGARKEYCDAILARAIQARDIAKSLTRAAESALAREVGF